MIPYLGPPFVILRESGNTGGQTKPKNERLHYETLEEAKTEFGNYFSKLTSHDFDGRKFKPGKRDYAYVEKTYDVKVSAEDERKEIDSSTLEGRLKDLIVKVGELFLSPVKNRFLTPTCWCHCMKNLEKFKSVYVEIQNLC